MAFPSGQAQWLRELAGQGWVQAIRSDGQRNLLAIARTVAVWADWDSLESRPTWAELMRRSGLERRCVARWLLELRLRGWLELLEHGSTPATRPMSLAHLEGHRAALYGLRLPLTPERALAVAAELMVDELATELAHLAAGAPSRTRPDRIRARSGRETAPGETETQADITADGGGPVEENGTLPWSCKSLEERSEDGSSRARNPVDKSPKQVPEQEKQRLAALRAGSEEKRRSDLLIMVPVSRYQMLACADALRRAHPLFGRCSRKLVRHLCKPFWRAGWCNRDILHALDHRPSMFVQVRRLSAPEYVVSPRQFIGSRLAAWRTENGTVRPGWTTRTAPSTAGVPATGPTGSAALGARELVRARHGQAGVRLLRAGEQTLTAERVAAHGRAAREPARAAGVPAGQERSARDRFRAELVRTARAELARGRAGDTPGASGETSASAAPPVSSAGAAGSVYERAVARARAEGHLPRRRGGRRRA